MVPQSKKVRSRKARSAFWERGYLSHGYWLGKDRAGQVRLGPHGQWDGVYRWQAGNHAGEAATLEDAKRAVEEVVLLGASQLSLFQDPANTRVQLNRKV